MSICNIWLNDHKALVVTDTNATSYVPGQEPVPGTVRKLFQHGDCVIAGRGAMGATYALHDLMLKQRIESVDTLQPRFAELCDQAAAEAEAIRQATHGSLVHEHAQDEEIYAVGWSKRLGAMVAICAERMGRTGTFTTENIPHACASPGIWKPEDMPDLSTLGGMVAAAKQQVKVFEERFPGAPIGGDLVFAQISPRSIIIDTITDW